MSVGPSVSIIIITRNRADHLQKTLESIARLKVLPTLATELVVVDNASTDETANVIRSCTLPNMILKYVHEPKPGKSNAINTGMAAARGDIFLWTDDDMRLPEEWIAMMCDPILTDKADGVSGKIRLAPHLERDWMTRTHYDRLADTRFMPEDFGTMIGANMAFSRRVLEKVPAFDPELGPGALGFEDDTLFSLQMRAAGFRIVALPSAIVEHHIEPLRLRRKAWLRHGEANGRALAYIRYHWEQEPVKFPRLKMLGWQIALGCFRVLYRPVGPDEEGCDRREIRMIQNKSFLDQYLKERKKKPKYTKRGLIKLDEDV